MSLRVWVQLSNTIPDFFLTPHNVTWKAPELAWNFIKRECSADWLWTQHCDFFCFFTCDGNRVYPAERRSWHQSASRCTQNSGSKARTSLFVLERWACSENRKQSIQTTGGAVISLKPLLLFSDAFLHFRLNIDDVLLCCTVKLHSKIRPQMPLYMCYFNKLVKTWNELHKRSEAAILVFLSTVYMCVWSKRLYPTMCWSSPGQIELLSPHNVPGFPIIAAFESCHR